MLIRKGPAAALPAKQAFLLKAQREEASRKKGKVCVCVCAHTCLRGGGGGAGRCGHHAGTDTDALTPHPHSLMDSCVLPPSHLHAHARTHARARAHTHTQAVADMKAQMAELDRQIAAAQRAAAAKPATATAAPAAPARKARQTSSIGGGWACVCAMYGMFAWHNG